MTDEDTIREIDAMLRRIIRLPAPEQLVLWERNSFGLIDAEDP